MKKHKPHFYGSQQIKGTPAWRIFSEYVRRNAKGICFTCGARVGWKALHAGHYISANVCGKTLFFDTRNVRGQCVRCNLFLHGNAPAFALALINEMGQEILNELNTIRLQEKKAGIICRYDKLELRKIQEKYQKKLKELTEAEKLGYEIKKIKKDDTNSPS